MSEWKSIDTAPRGDVKLVKHPKTGKMYQAHVPVNIIGYKGDFVCETYWIPPEKSARIQQGRWHKFTHKETLEGWQPMPVSPNVEAE